jgi:hypothetical protein
MIKPNDDARTEKVLSGTEALMEKSRALIRRSRTLVARTGVLLAEVDERIHCSEEMLNRPIPGGIAKVESLAEESAAETQDLVR